MTPGEGRSPVPGEDSLELMTKSHCRAPRPWALLAAGQTVDFLSEGACHPAIRNKDLHLLPLQGFSALLVPGAHGAGTTLKYLSF